MSNQTKYGEVSVMAIDHIRGQWLHLEIPVCVLRKVAQEAKCVLLPEYDIMLHKLVPRLVVFGNYRCRKKMFHTWKLNRNSYEVQIDLKKPFAKHCVLTGSRAGLYVNYLRGTA